MLTVVPAALGLLCLNAAAAPAPPAVELPVTSGKAAEPGCTLVLTAADTALLGCGNTLVFQRDGQPLGRPEALGDMQCKGARAFQEGARVLWVVDVGDEGNSSLEFHAVEGARVTHLGRVDWMVDGGDSVSALPHLRAAHVRGALEFTVARPVVRLDARGLPVAVKRARVRVERKRVVAERP